MKEAIQNFAKQFSYNPVVENVSQVKPFKHFVVLGMGGSHLAADLLKLGDPLLPLTVHHDYGLPPLPDAALQRSLIIASSYSGNTEETLDGFTRARDKGYSVAALSIGGKLLELAKSMGVPFVQMPDTNIQPRCALGFNMRGLLKLLGKEDTLAQTGALAANLNPLVYEETGKALAARIKGRTPVIYASGRNRALAYTWKIKFNETGKIPAFYNTFPELNHNEMTGFDINESSTFFADRFYGILLKDPNDDQRILRRMEILEKLYRDRGIALEAFELAGEDIWHKLFSSLLIADWAALYNAEQYGLEPEQVPMIEEFKKLIA